MTERETQIMQGRFSELLWIPHSHHRVSLASKENSTNLNMRNYRTNLLYHDRYAPYLLSLGLYQVAKLPGINIDASLIHALVERWRPETHTFHLPFGEMTVTLEDVSCLWGLPIKGVPVTGRSDGVWARSRMFELLEIRDVEVDLFMKKRGSAHSDWIMTKKMLRQRFKKLPDGADERTVQWYVRAFILELLSCTMFPDNSGDGIPLWYLDMIGDLEQPVGYNWGGAVLAYLYRYLCLTTDPSVNSMHGPVMLLQHWSWTRFPVHRPMPKSRKWTPSWGQPTLETCPAFADKWCTKHAYDNSAHNKTAGPKIPRGQFQRLDEGMVDWEPYARIYEKLSRVTQAGQPYYLYCGPLIFYWIVEYHHPERCMRQFGKYQHIPPPPPLNKNVHSDLHKLKMASKRNISWADKHAIHVDKAETYEQNIYAEARPFEHNELPAYRKWYQMNDMASVYIFEHHVEGLDRGGRISRDEHGKKGYIPSGPPIVRLSLRGIGELAHGVKQFFTKGWRRPGKDNMRRGWGICCDCDVEDRARALMDQAGVPENWEEVPSNESTEIGVNPYPPPPVFEGPDPIQSWLYDGSTWRNYMAQSGVGHDADPEQMTQEVQAQQQGVNSSDFIQNLLASGGPYASAYDAGQLTQEHLDEWQFQQQTLQAQQASHEEFIRHQREVPPTPGRNWHFGDVGASSSQPPLNTQTQPEVTQHDEYRRPTQRVRREAYELRNDVRSPDRFSHSQYPGH